MRREWVTVTLDELTKSQRKALNRLTGFGSLETLSIESDGKAGVFAKVGSIHVPMLFWISARGRVKDLSRRW